LEDQHKEDGKLTALFFSPRRIDFNGGQFVVTNVVTILIPLWGMIGIWTNKFGYDLQDHPLVLHR
jgi:hypothetical protein